MTERNIEVAKRLGYHIYHYDKDVESRCYYQLWEPDGNPIGLYPDNEYKTEVEAWQDVPQWDGDLNLALKLLEYQSNVVITLLNKRWMLDREWFSLEDLPGAIVDWFLANVDVKALEKERKAKELKDKIAELQDELSELDSA